MHDPNKQKDIDTGDPKRPLTVRELALIVLSGHLGVRKQKHRALDFERAKGLHVFLAAAFYFLLLVTGLIVLVVYIAN